MNETNTNSVNQDMPNKEQLIAHVESVMRKWNEGSDVESIKE